MPPVFIIKLSKPTPFVARLYPEDAIVAAPPKVITPVKLVIFPKFLIAPCAVPEVTPDPVIVKGSFIV